MASKPTIVLVHGASHTPAHFQNVISRLEKAGYEVEAPHNPSSAKVPVENAQAKDIANIHHIIRRITDAGKNVVVVMHSYGGICGSEAVGEFFETARGRTEQGGGKGSVVQLVYICAFILPPGRSAMQDGNTQHIIDVDPQGMIWHLEPYHRFYNTTPPSVARKAIDLLNAQAMEVFTTPPRYQGWNVGIPVTYIACKQDRALMYDPVLLKFIGRLRDSGVDLTVVEMDCDHSPWFSAEDEFHAILDEVLPKTT